MPALPKMHTDNTYNCDKSCGTVDLVTTLMDRAGRDLADSPYDGVSLKPVLTGKKDEVRTTVYGEMGHSRAVIKEIEI